MTSTLVKGTFLICAVFGSLSTSAASWFETEKKKCEFHGNASFKLPFIRKTNSAGGQYFVVPKSNLNQVLNTPNGVVQTVTTLNSNDLAVFKATVDTMRTGPQSASAALAIAGQLTDFSGLYGIAADGLLTWLGAKVEARAIHAERLIDFITVGGQAGHEVAFRSAPIGFKPLLLVITSYQVQVGAEPRPRKWLLATCLIPLEIALSEVITTAVGPNANNKRLTKTNDNIWQQWDITDSRFDSRRYRYVEQDEAFAYFVDQNDAASRYRIHMYGGPMQMNREGVWATLYLTTESK